MRARVGMTVVGMCAAAAMLMTAAALPASGQTTTTAPTTTTVPGTVTNGPYTTVNPYTARDFATGFDSELTSGFKDPFRFGPLGLAFDPLGNLWVGDLSSGKLYKFGVTGGAANGSNFAQQLDPGISGIAFDKFGRMFIGNIDTNALDELNPITGAVIRTVTTAIKCPLALAFDPTSGDLFTSQGACGDLQIKRIHDAESSNPTVTTYSSGLDDVDAVAFIPDGTMYAVDNEGPQAKIVRLGSTQGATPGLPLTTIANVTYGDGMTFSLPVGTNPPQYMYINRNDGIVTRLDLTTNPPVALNVMTGGTRGDLATTAADGCLYPTQSESVVKIGFNNGLCNGLPTLVPQVPNPPPTTLPPATTPPTTAPPTTAPAAAGNGNGGSPAPAGGSGSVNGTGAAGAPAAPASGNTLPLTGWDSVWALLGVAALVLIVLARRAQRQTRRT